MYFDRTALIQLGTVALTVLLSAGCASHSQPASSVTIVNRGEHLIGYDVPAGPTKPRHAPVDLSKDHLLEIYNGQQKIIERMEARQRKKEQRKLGEEAVDDTENLAEGRAAPLPDDISPEDLLRILEKQQSLIDSLNSISRN